MNTRDQSRSGSREVTWLVLRARAGDREAIEKLLERVQRSLFGYLLNLTADRSLAEDLLQDVLFLIYRKLRFLRDPALFEPWAFRIASRATWRKLARRRQLREEPLESEPVHAEVIEEGHPLVENLSSHLEALSPASRAVVTLHYLHEMNLHEIAGVLEIPIGTVKSRLAYGLRCLRRAVDAESR